MKNKILGYKLSNGATTFSPKTFSTMTLGKKIRHPAVPVLDTDCCYLVLFSASCRFALCRFPECRGALKIGTGCLGQTGINVIKTFFFVTVVTWPKKAILFIPGKPLKPSVMLTNKARAYQSVSHLLCSTLGSSCGLYYKPMTIVNEDSRVVTKLETSLTDDARVVFHNRHMFIVLATGFTCKILQLNVMF
jgi:hypothetical protein